jgi:hypothetical protein
MQDRRAVYVYKYSPEDGGPGILRSFISLKGLCHEINNFWKVLKNQISTVPTFCICADSLKKF